MPSVRPKLVEEGIPISGRSVDSEDDNGGRDTTMAMLAKEGSMKKDSMGSSSKSNNTKFGDEQQQQQQQQQRSRSSLSTSATSRTNTASTHNNNDRSSSLKRSSLARAAKGTLISDKSSTKKSVVQTSYVVGGSAAGTETKIKKNSVQTTYVVGGNSNYHHDEKKSADHPSDIAIDPPATKNKINSSSVTQTRYVVGRAGTTDSLQQEHNTKKQPVVQTSYVVGGNSHFEEEKKSADSPANNNNNNNNNSSNSMIIDDSLQHTTTLTAASFLPVPGNIDTSMQPDNSFSSGVHSMEVDLHHHNLHYQEHTVPQPHHHDDLEDDDTQVEKMEGVIDLSEKPPMVVIDGANIAYAYDRVWQGESSSLAAASQRKPEPDARGIVVACDYFVAAGIRVLAVIPSTMMLRDPHRKILQKLEQQKLLVPAPSQDDDDAYAIVIARREDGKAQQRGDGPGYVMSNDMFRDAIRREQEERGDESDLGSWLKEGSSSALGKTGPGRISFTFCDTGSIDDHGDKILDIVPNPRHPLIQFIEQTKTHAA